MNARKKFRAIMTGKRLVLMPGAYDGLSARIIEAEGFEAVTAGGYAAIGSMLAQPDTGQSNMRDYADHYGRICAAVEVPVMMQLRGLITPLPSSGLTKPAAVLSAAIAPYDRMVNG